MTPVPYSSSMLHIPQTIYCLLALQKNKTKQKKTRPYTFFVVEISENQKGQKQKKDKIETATVQETITRKQVEKWNQNRFLRFRQGKNS